MKELLGVICLILAVVAGIVVGIGWALVGGIIDIVEAFQSPPVVPVDVAIGVCKVLFFQLIGGITCIVCAIPGMIILEDTL